MAVGQRAPSSHFICSFYFIEVADKDDWESWDSIGFHSQQAMKYTVVHNSVKPSSFSVYSMWFVIFATLMVVQY